MNGGPIRPLRSAEARAAADLIARGMVLGQPWAGWDADLLRRRTARLLRLQARLARIFGRASPFGRSFVYRGAGGQFLGVATWVPGRRAGWLAAVAIEPGPDSVPVARALLQAAGRAGAARGLAPLLVPGWAWAGSGLPEEALESLGFDEVAAVRLWRRAIARLPSGVRPPAPLRIPRGIDRSGLLEGVRQERGIDLERIEPSRGFDLEVRSGIAWALGSTTGLFVDLAGARALTAVRATRGGDASAAHLTVVRAPEASESGAIEAIGRAVRWCQVPGVREVVAECADTGSPTAPLLARCGFVPGPRSRTYVRSVGAAG